MPRSLTAVSSEPRLIRPEWPAPANVRAISTTRAGGVSGAPWDSLNLGSHVGDDADHVRENRRRLARALQLEDDAIAWLSQVHGTGLVRLPAPGVPEADAALADQPGQVCAIMTADCLPVLFCNRSGTRVAAAHGGWRGLCDGVLEAVVAGFEEPAGELLAWLGPAIGPGHFEVGPEVRAAFVAQDARADAAFSAQGARPGHCMANIYELARLRLAAAGVTQIYGGSLCTVSDPERFYSYRRDGQTGRMACLIWLAD